MKIIFPRIIVIVLIILLTGCKKTDEKKISLNTDVYFSKSVNDEFMISVSLPEDYNKNKKYPVVYLLDANLYFDILSTTFRKYSEVGLLPPVILVGIGYKDLETMDSLRQRDFTYPTAIPEYEMEISGKADKFLSFISNELILDIDKKYRVDKDNRILMGHSLGGYFTLYALRQNLIKKNNIFCSYIAASPSTHYNHNYILNEFEKLKFENKSNTKIYITFGGLEDTENEEEDIKMLKTDKVLLSLKKSLQDNCKINYKGENYSNLGHMGTQLPTFIKGIQWTFNMNE